MKVLHIHHFSVDTERGRIHNGDAVTPLEPRVLQVLLHLARHQGEVVSHQSLMEAVWGQSIVDPSTLQRCIGQLRRAFGDDARQQHTIATYPKTGYSLLPEVNWSSRPSRTPVTPPSVLKMILGHLPAVMAGLAALLILPLVWLTVQDDSPEAPATADIHHADAGTGSTASVAHADFQAVYSPDGRFVAYSRSHDGSRRLLLGRDLASGREFPLTQTPGHYADLAWSPDSQQLVFTVSSPCHALQAVSLPDAAAGHASQETLTDCSNTVLRSPQWLDRQHIAMISGEQIAVLDLHSDETTVLYSADDATPQQLAWSTVSQRLAVLEKQQAGNTALLLMTDMNGGQPVLNRISLLPEMSSQQLHLVWNPAASGLLISTATALYNVGLDGSISRQAPPFLPDSAFPSQH